MKHILKSIAILFFGAALFASCNPEENLATSITVDKKAVSFTSSSPAAQTVKVSANGDWYAFAPSWITVTPSHGSGNTEVSIVAMKNVNEWSEPNAPRKDVISFWADDDASAVIDAFQDGEAGLDATRNFRKITKAEEWDPTKTSMIVFDIDGGLNALLPWKGADETKYSYLFVTPVKEVEEGVISYPNASLAYTFVPKNENYALLQSNGHYLFGSGGYSSMYSTTNLATADVWTVTFTDDGHANVTNVTLGKIFHYSTKYSNVEEVAEPTGILPYIYQDQAAASSETLTPDKETVYLSSNATSASIALSANCHWTVRNHDDWVTSFTKSGENDGTIEIAFGANTTDADREAEFQIIGEETNITVKLVQSAPLTSVAAINSWLNTGATSYAATLKDAVVSYVNGSNAFIQDATGGILLYKSGHGLTAGKKLNGSVSGTATVYNKLFELTGFEKAEGFSEADTTFVPAVVTVADLNKDFAKYISMLVKVEGVDIVTGVSSSAKSGKIAQGEDQIATYLKGSATISTGSKGDLVCIPTVNNDTKQLGIWANDHFTATLVGTVITAPASLEVSKGTPVSIGATVNTEAVLSYECTDPTVATVDATGLVTPVKIGETSVKITAPAKEGEYSAAEVTVAISVVAALPKKTIAAADLPTAYGTEAPGTEFTSDGITYYAFQTANFGSGLQMKKNVSAYFANKTAFSSKIVKISLPVYTEKTVYADNIKVYAGSTELPSETEITTTSTSSPFVYDFSAGNYTYFKVVNVSSYAVNFDTVTITLAE